MFRRHWPWWLLAIAVVALLLLLLAPRARTVDTVEVSQGALVQSVVATGRVASPARIEIASQLAARIERVAVREGDRVTPQAELLVLRSDEAEANLAVATAAHNEASARLRQLAQVQRPVADQQWRQAQAARVLAEAEEARARTLVAQGFVSQARVDDAVRALAVARAAESAALAQAQANRVDGVEVELAQARLRQAQASLDAARARLDLLVLRAPVAAHVLTRQAEPGDTAQIGRVLLTLAEEGETRIIASVDEKNLRHVRAGVLARAVADAFPGDPFDARVFYVAPSVDAERGTVEIRLVVPTPPEFLRPDMTVSVELQVGRRERTLRLASDAVRDIDTQPYVLVARDGRAVRQTVGLGLRGIGTVEVLDGLAAEEQVILPTSPALPGDRVRPQLRQAPDGPPPGPPPMAR